MKLAIMQPYFLPYLGYFQLMAAVDRFVVYDDVRFIKRGWINRNRILLKGRDHLFTVPLHEVSQNRNINEIELVAEKVWKEKLLRTIKLAYSRAPCFPEIFPLLSAIINFAERNLAAFLLNALLTVRSYLDISTQIVTTSGIYQNRELTGAARILDICRKEGATIYVNASGGRTLYEADMFQAHEIALRFVEPLELRYKQFGRYFQPSLSIIDVLMFNSREETRSLLSRFELKA
jgi:WbqC-like protein family